ncbi:MAG TPA: ATP-binding protein [Opitutaceae bacterium]|nr:ATP-binding protein [Opitutaceae bacterium]
MKPRTLEPQQAWLAETLDRIYLAITAGATGEKETPPRPDPAPGAAATPLDHLRRGFGLSPFECDLLLLCLGSELESRFGQACASAHNDPRLSQPTFGLAMGALAEAHWSAMARNRPLRYWHFIEVGTGDRLVNSPLRIDERVLHFLIGLPCIDERLEPTIRPLPEHKSALSPAQTQSARLASRYWSGPFDDPRQRRPVLLVGKRSFEQQLVAQEAFRSIGLQPYTMRVSDIPANAAERELLARLCNRELVLDAWGLYLQSGDQDNAENVRHVSAFLSQIRMPVAVEVRENSPLEQLEGLRISVSTLNYTERKALWMENLGEFAASMNGELDRIAEGFNFDAPAIRIASAVVRDTAAESPEPGRVAWQVCRTHARKSLDNLAQRIEPKCRWEDLVLPPLQIDILRQIVAHVRHRPMVHDRWGFAKKYARGLGVAALFAGGSGTGKTMAAEIISVELERDVYQIDLASIVSKYIGETEKNLRRIFDAADESAAVLLFNEADALFGKRSEIKDSHDRYANLEISYLLQRMESYEGVAILTTNMKHALDTAFLRRLRFIVQFPFPEAEQRQAIWQKVFPSQAPLRELDFRRLAQMNISGGVIRNIAMHAAFLAAEEDSPIDMNHILRAARVEYAKMDKSLTGPETGGWS